jgi:hypothetical protein
MQKEALQDCELIVEGVDWEPKARRKAGNSIVGWRIDWREIELRSKVKQAGGKWNPKRRVWEMRYDRVVELGLEGRKPRRVFVHARTATLIGSQLR